jgi:hypothetical protein
VERRESLSLITAGPNAMPFIEWMEIKTARLPVLAQRYAMLQRNLLYTGIP